MMARADFEVVTFRLQRYRHKVVTGTNIKQLLTIISPHAAVNHSSFGNQQRAIPNPIADR
jgi:hypothetical protein